MSVNVGHAVVECIRSAGTTMAFCVPGESYLGILDAFYDAPDVDLITTRHEEGAGLMAEAYAKLTGKVGVVLVTRGPGVTHLSIALHTAMQDSTPLVALVGQVPTRYRGRESFQELNLEEYGSTLTKWAVEVTIPQRVPEILQRAFMVAASGRPGPVLVSIPEDIDRSVVEDPAPAAVQFLASPGPGPEAVRAAAELLARTPGRIAIVAGGGVIRSAATTALVELAERLGAGVYTAWRRFDAFPNDHPLYLGNLPGMPEALYEGLTEAEVVLAVGTRLGEYTTRGYAIPGVGQRLVHIDVSSDVLARSGAAAHRIQGDCAATLGAVLNGLDKFGEVTEGVLAGRQAAVKREHARFVDATTPQPRTSRTPSVDLDGLFWQVRDQLPADTVITSDAGTFSGWLNRFYRWTMPGTYLGPTAGGMGYAVPAAISAKLAVPERQVVAFAGDGGFAMTMSELATAVRYRLRRLIFVVVNNDLYGSIRVHQRRNFPGRDVGVDLSRIDFAAAARSMGAAGEVIESDDEAGPALTRALAADLPFVLDVRTDSSELNPWKSFG